MYKPFQVALAYLAFIVGVIVIVAVLTKYGSVLP